MDFDDPVTGRSRRKMKLRRDPANPDGSLNADTASSDDECALGKWLYGEGAALKGSPEYAKLRAEHAQFHRGGARCEHGPRGALEVE